MRYILHCLKSLSKRSCPGCSRQTRDFLPMLQPLEDRCLLSTLSISGSLDFESHGALSFLVSLSEASTQPMTVDFETQNATAKARFDFTALAGTLTFDPGQTSISFGVRII